MEELKREKAVALRYDGEKEAAPYLIAKGRGVIARKIRELAQEYGVPLHQDEVLADYLLALDLYEEIPPELYAVVAEVLAFIYRMHERY
ncbi:flagellar biosynthesis protein [Thermosyntropha lipolytica DSM 11003]|uniref:Flagellar biosynthesis protein n=1 Tax=Thermosyntropha lipolytica DSM 11003 TaxID=1123382 RepID=A0A1M5QNS8_9FIRM|nr:EscU/YscU/HrcU family type III secretion system export apparatus switch protein [Thermosyntropha lipolytica]SHH15469.1 flagellar biosynthesis protein [Thermosyntropha lipolytica DSM 11003]